MGTFIKLAVVVAVIFGGWKIWHDRHKTQAHVFEVHGEEAYDAATNLTWKRCSVGQTWSASGCARGIPGYRWEAAQHLGDDKWRVPTEKELATLIDPARAARGDSPAVDVIVFPGMEREGATYWTSSIGPGDKAWYVRFSPGAKGINAAPGSYLQAQLNEYSVHLVHAGR